MAEQEAWKYTPTEARLRERVKGSLEAYAHEFGIDGEAAMDEWIDQALAERDAEVRADERAKRPDRIEELEKNLSYEVEQKIKLADTLRDERAKRPDREQIAHALWAHDGGSLCRAPICRYNDDDADADYECQCTHCWAIALSMAFAVLALEPEAREEPGQVEWGVAYRQNDGKLFVDEAVDYDDAVFRVANSSVYDMVVQRRVTAYAPVGAAPAPEAREETGPALRIDDDGAHIYWADPVEGCWVAFKRVDCVGEEELPERRLPAPDAREEPKGRSVPCERGQHSTCKGSFVTEPQRACGCTCHVPEAASDAHSLKASSPDGLSRTGGVHGDDPRALLGLTDDEVAAIEGRD